MDPLFLVRGSPLTPPPPPFAYYLSRFGSTPQDFRLQSFLGAASSLYAQAATMASVVSNATELKLHSCIGFTGENKGVAILARPPGFDCAAFSSAGPRVSRRRSVGRGLGHLSCLAGCWSLSIILLLLLCFLLGAVLVECRLWCAEVRDDRDVLTLTRGRHTKPTKVLRFVADNNRPGIVPCSYTTFLVEE